MPGWGILAIIIGMILMLYIFYFSLKCFTKNKIKGKKLKVGPISDSSLIEVAIKNTETNIKVTVDNKTPQAQ